MLDIARLRKNKLHIISIGSYPSIIQSILDFDYLVGKQTPSIKAIIATGRNSERYFWGKKEILLPVFTSAQSIPQKDSINFFLNLSSGRRVFASTCELLDILPAMLGGVVFAENVPEQHAIALYQKIKDSDRFIVGPASIGVLIPNMIKAGAIGGVDARQFVESSLFDSGSVAVLSSSGGMTNELIRTVAQSGKRLSFALSFGGERFPITTPKDAFLAAEKDDNTKTIVYFGELGGTDEFDIADLLQSKKVTKPVVCYIAGVIADIFPTPPQFGHAKALAQKENETAQEKRDVLKKAGAKVADSYTQFLEFIKDIEDTSMKSEREYTTIIKSMENRQHALITTSISGDKDGNPQILGENLLDAAKNNSFAAIVGSLFLGQKIKSKELEEFVDFVLRLLVDHGPYVSGAVNTIISARAGRDLVSALSTGLLTIGPRFGGAINQAAENWIQGVTTSQDQSLFVEDFATHKKYISGIGHKKYRIDLPDPRVKEILRFAEKLEEKRFTNFALAIEKITTAKKGNLILNVDGAIAAVLLDILSEREHLQDDELQKLTQIEFFNGLFVLSRSVGFMAHYFDQKRLDEGLFRLDENLVAEVGEKE